MSVYKCKMCGGSLNVNEGDRVVECEFCGTSQTITTSDNNKIIELFGRGNQLRTECEFDKAYNVFLQIISKEESNAEAYWNLLLCKYGITYVDDYDGKKKPTINRMSVDSILNDSDYLKTLALSDVITRSTYEKEAKEIAKIQENILSIMNKEKPYDVFISYKETDDFGDRTKDSILAQEIYDTLTKEGHRVFLSRVSLQSAAGEEYEPYIYSALYSSKIMILVTTSIDYINSVWVKNEWSRFIGMMEKNQNKKLVPCYTNVDPYDLPKELRNIQGLDMSKLGFIQDLVVGVNKILGKTKKEEVHSDNINTSTNKVENLVKRCKLLIEDKEFEKARKIVEENLNEFPESGELYAILLQCDYSKSVESLSSNPIYIQNNKNYAKIKRFGNEELVKTYNKIHEDYNHNEYKRIQKICDSKDSALKELEKAIDDCYYLDEKIVDVKTISGILKDKLDEKEFKVKDCKDIEYEFEYKNKEVIVSLHKDVVYLNEDKEHCFYYEKIVSIKTELDEVSKMIICGRSDIGELKAVSVYSNNEKELAECVEEIYNRVMILGNTNCRTEFALMGKKRIISETINFKKSLENKEKLNVQDVFNASKLYNGLQEYDSSDDTISELISYLSPIVDKYKEILKDYYANMSINHLHYYFEYNALEQTMEFGMDDSDFKVNITDITSFNIKRGSSIVSITIYVKEGEQEKSKYFCSAKSTYRMNDELIEKLSELYGFKIIHQKGCYVATAVYGSYDCREVWLLRRYRDEYLDTFAMGRLFIKLYYAISPTIVKLFGNCNWFKKPIKKILDKKIAKLKNKGYEDTPYNDKY